MKSWKWFRFYPDIINDIRFQGMSEVMQRRLIMIMCLRPRFTKRARTDEHVAWYLRMTPKTTRKTKEFLMAKGFLDASWNVLIWKDRQLDERRGDKEWKKIRERIFDRDNYTCVYCGAHVGTLHCDHVMPISRGGSNEEDNLVTACDSCNHKKHAKTPEQWRGTSVDEIA